MKILPEWYTFQVESGPFFNYYIQFTTGAMYEYNYSRTGSYHIENMKRLAMAGSGLNSYINTNVKYSYSRKIR